MANEKHNIPLLNLDGPTLTVHFSVSSPFPNGFNKSFYMIKAVTINFTFTDAPPLGKINTFVCDELLALCFSAQHC
jgi:hypothetical protein